MKINTAQDVLNIVYDRGFSVRVEPGPPPMPFLVVANANPKDATEALLAALKAWRLEIIEILKSDAHAKP